ncbi:MAG: type II toxin-antitoxin system RelE/ParE family toxin [Patescibacteria group bacterium]
MKIVISPRAEKQFRKLQKFDQIAITQKIRSRLESISNEEKLSGYKDIYRVRVGNYRIIYRRGNFAYIILIGHRKEVYRLLKDVLR